MPRLARHLRRPAVVLAGLFLAGAGLLAGTLPPRPFAEFRVRLDTGRYYDLVGISPDGNTIATRQSDWGPGRASANVTEPETIWLWNLDEIVNGRGATVVAVETPFPRYGPDRSVAQTGWQRLFWTIVLAPSPYREQVRLLGRGGRYGDVWLSADGRWLVRFGWPDPPDIGPAESSPVYFVSEWGTPHSTIRIPLAERPMAVTRDTVLLTAD